MPDGAMKHICGSIPLVVPYNGCTLDEQQRNVDGYTFYSGKVPAGKSCVESLPSRMIPHFGEEMRVSGIRSFRKEAELDRSKIRDRVLYIEKRGHVY